MIVIFLPRSARTISAVTVTFARSSVPVVTVSPSTSMSGVWWTVSPTLPSTLFMTPTSPTDTFSCRPRALTIAYTTLLLISVVTGPITRRPSRRARRTREGASGTHRRSRVRRAPLPSKWLNAASTAGTVWFRAQWLPGARPAQSVVVAPRAHADPGALGVGEDPACGRLRVGHQLPARGHRRLHPLLGDVVRHVDVELEVTAGRLLRHPVEPHVRQPPVRVGELAVVLLVAEHRRPEGPDALGADDGDPDLEVVDAVGREGHAELLGDLRDALGERDVRLGQRAARVRGHRDVQRPVPQVEV